MSLYSKFKKHILDHHFFVAGESLVLGVSGGLDSVVLLHLCSRLSREMPLRIIVAHVNYHLRGKASDLDEVFVSKLSFLLNIVSEIHSGEISSKSSLQDQARRIRYAHFEKVAKKHRCSKVVLAHHLQDQVETFLIKLIQGAGVQGLKSMEAESFFSKKSKLKVLRPLLPFSKEELREFARSEGLKWREDASNQKEDYLRNSVRLSLLPAFEKLSPKATFKIAEAVEVIQSENEWMSLQCEKIMKGRVLKKAGKIFLRLAFLQKQAPSMRHRIYSKLFSDYFPSVRLNRDYLKNLDDMVVKEKKRMKLSFSAGCGAYLDQACLVFVRWRKENLHKSGFFQ